MKKIFPVVGSIALILWIGSFGSEAGAASSSAVTQKQIQKLQAQLSGLQADLTVAQGRILKLENQAFASAGIDLSKVESRVSNLEGLTSGMTLSEIEWLALNSGSRRCGTSGVSISVLSIPNSSNGLARCTGYVLVKKPN